MRRIVVTLICVQNLSKAFKNQSDLPSIRTRVCSVSTSAVISFSSASGMEEKEIVSPDGSVRLL